VEDWQRLFVGVMNVCKNSLGQTSVSKLGPLSLNRREVMPKGYWIVRVDVTDHEQFKLYMAAAVDPLKRHGARFLVRAGRFENPEGQTRSRNTVIEFPSYEAAVECWQSLEYQQAVRMRQPASTMDLVIIEGYEGPQPS